MSNLTDWQQSPFWQDRWAKEAAAKAPASYARMNVLPAPAPAPAAPPAPAPAPPAANPPAAGGGGSSLGGGSPRPTPPPAQPAPGGGGSSLGGSNNPPDPTQAPAGQPALAPGGKPTTSSLSGGAQTPQSPYQYGGGTGDPRYRSGAPGGNGMKTQYQPGMSYTQGGSGPGGSDPRFRSGAPYAGTTSFSQGAQQYRDNQAAADQWRFQKYNNDLNGGGYTATLRGLVGPTPTAGSGDAYTDTTKPPGSDVAWSPGQTSSDVNQAGGGSATPTNTGGLTVSNTASDPSSGAGQTTGDDTLVNQLTKPEPVV